MKSISQIIDPIFEKIELKINSFLNEFISFAEKLVNKDLWFWFLKAKISKKELWNSTKVG